jgi:hypothetical protein
MLSSSFTQVHHTHLNTAPYGYSQLSVASLFTYTQQSGSTSPLWMETWRWETLPPTRTAFHRPSDQTSAAMENCVSPTPISPHFSYGYVGPHFPTKYHTGDVLQGMDELSLYVELHFYIPCSMDCPDALSALRCLRSSLSKSWLHKTQTQVSLSPTSFLSVTPLVPISPFRVTDHCFVLLILYGTTLALFRSLKASPIYRG